MTYPDYLVFDCETTGATNGTFGNPFCDSNRLVVLGYSDGNRGGVVYALNDQSPHSELWRDFLELETDDCISVGFNWKFDAHWRRRNHVAVPLRQPVWDCQLAHFIIHDQQKPLPSLEDCSDYYGLESKFIDIETEYWKKGIDNDQVPFEILHRRVTSDVSITSRLFELQIDHLRSHPGKKRLIWVACQDQKVLEEMEWNGLKYNLELSRQEGDKLRARQKEIEHELDEIVGFTGTNWNSKDHLSAILFGGTVDYKYRERYLFTYKDGSTTTKERWSIRSVPRERRVAPLKGTEYSKGGVWSTDAGVLPKLKIHDRATKRIIELIQEHRKLDKRVGTYYHGIPKLYEEMNWTNSILHGSLQSSVTKTGRLSSTNPNQQNMDHKIRACIESRYPLVQLENALLCKPA